MPHAKSKQDPERVRNGAGGSSIASEVQARSRKKSKSQATATTTAATAMCNMDSHDCPPRAGADADADADPSSTAIIASGSNTRGIRHLRRSASCAAMTIGRFDSNTVTTTGTSSSPDRVPPGDREAAAAAGLGCNMIRNDSSDSVNLPHDDMSVLLCMHSAEHEGASGSSPAASSSREGAAAAGTCRSGYPSGETSSSAGDGQQQQRRCDACYQDAGSSGDDDDSLLLLLPDAKLGIPSEESEPEVVMDQQDSGTATTDWNGFWIPVVGNDDADHMMHLMSSEVGSGPGAAGPRIMQQQQQQQGESFFPAVDGHGSSHVTVVAYGAPAGILRTASAQEHHHGQQQQQQSSDDDRSGFLLEPMFTTSRGIYSSSSPSRSRTSPMSTLRRAEAEEEDSETAAPAAAAAARGRGDHVHMPHQFKQHSSSAAAAHLEVDFCESLLNVEDQQQQQANVNSSASRIFMSGIMSDDVMSMSNLDTINYCGHTSTSSAAATPGPAANMWMPMMDQWMEDRSNSLAAAAQIQQQQQQPQEVEWTCNYPQAGPPAAYLPPAAHHLIGVGATAYNAMIQQQIAPGGRHVFPPPSAPHMSTHLPFMHTSPTTTMASSSQLAMGGGRSLSTSALHSDPCTTTATSSIFTNTSVGCIPPLRRHSAAVKRSLSFMQSRDEDDAHNPCSAADRASAGVGDISNNNNHLDNASDAPVAHTAATTSAVAPLGLKLGIGNNSSTTSSGCATVADTTTVTSLRPGIDDAAAQLSALLYTKSRTDIGNNAISQYHKLAFQNSFYNNNNSSKLDSCPSSSLTSSSGVGLASKNAARRRHGTATDPQSIAARTRRERFSDRIRILQSLVPNGERLDTVSMLGQTLEYVRFLQHQVWQLYNGTSSAPISASTHVHGAAAAAAATNLAAQVASAESLAASFLSSMAQRQAAAAATPSPELLSSSSSSNSNNNTNSSSSNGSGSKLAAAAGLGLVDKWKKLAASPHVPAEFTPVA